jgi:tetratricopeptide (TPR) repeat protein
MADLETAIQHSREALDATPADHPDRPHRLESLGNGYQDRYRRTGAIADLETAIQHSQEALDATPADHPHLAHRLGSLGIGYRDRYQRTGAIADFETAIQHFQEGLDNTVSSVKERLRCGRILVELHARRESWPQAYQTASKTVSLVLHLHHTLLKPRISNIYS